MKPPRVKQLRLFLVLVCAACACTAVAQSASQTSTPPATFFSFDFPGATNTQATAINVGGKIVGRYTSRSPAWISAERNAFPDD